MSVTKVHRQHQQQILSGVFCDRACSNSHFYKTSLELTLQVYTHNGTDGLCVVAMVVAGLSVERFGHKKLFVGSGLIQVSYFTPPVLVVEEGGRVRLM